jgi:PadR family transcriptional regulator PadR
MRRRAIERPGDLLGGSLDLLILRTLELGANHGFAIAQSIGQRSNAKLLVEEGSLYPALHRLEERGWIDAKWGVSGHNRRAKFYELTRAGRKHLSAEAHRWADLAAAVARVLAPVP